MSFSRIILLAFFLYPNIDCKLNTTKAKKFAFVKPAPKYDNPNFIRDRFRDEIWKPMMNESWVNRFKKPYHPAWMDYCDPYHCGDYHKRACGLNRHNMRFKWFQSACHIILNNKCASFRGNLKYDLINSTFCNTYVMHLREGCPTSCTELVRPVCAISLVNNHIVLFKNRCTFEINNCKGWFEEYEEISPKVCVKML